MLVGDRRNLIAPIAVVNGVVYGSFNQDLEVRPRESECFVYKPLQRHTLIDRPFLFTQDGGNQRVLSVAAAVVAAMRQRLARRH